MTVLLDPPRRAGTSGSISITIAVGAGLLSLGLSLWQLSVPGFLSFYDSGVYLGASIHLISGVMPYRDFTFVQPPGILLVLSPVAVFSRIFGSHDGFVLARVLSAIIAALNVSLLAWLVRHRGRVAMVIAGAGFALLPVVAFDTSSVKLEPSMICFVLLGSLVIFTEKRSLGPLSTRRLVIGGALFGLAATIKIWAFFPFLALVICLVPSYRRRALLFIAGAAGAFALVVLPFLIAAPHSFVSQVIVEQLGRTSISANDGGVLWRLNDILGFYGTSLSPGPTVVVVAFIALAALAAVACWKRMPDESIDLYLLVAAISSVLALLTAPEGYIYYAYFTAPFLLGVIGSCVGRLIAQLSAPVERRVPALSKHRRAVRWSVGLVALGLLIAMTSYTSSFYSSETRAIGYDGFPFEAITNIIPKGSCVLYDQLSYGIFSDRFTASSAGCPSVVDPYGMWMAFGYQAAAPSPEFIAEWQGYMQSADYVVLSAPDATGIPWEDALLAWFRDNFSPVYGQDGVYIYKSASPGAS